MNKVLKMGNRLAVAALRKNLKCSDEKGLLHDTTERNRLEKQYMIDLMSKTLHLANEQVKDKIVYVGNPRKSISDILEQCHFYQRKRNAVNAADRKSVV